MAREITLDDFLRQLDQIQKMGPEATIARVPGLSKVAPEEFDWNASVSSYRRMIDAMTDDERGNPDLITPSRVPEIARRSETRPKDVEEFLAQFHRVRAMMRQMSEMSLWQRIKLVLGFRRPPGPSGEASS
jgi:signal recognition particle subunit SRP54